MIAARVLMCTDVAHESVIKINWDMMCTDVAHENVAARVLMCTDVAHES